MYAIKQFPCMVLFWLEASLTHTEGLHQMHRFFSGKIPGLKGILLKYPRHLHFASSLFELMPYGPGQITDGDNVTHGCLDSFLLVNQPSIPYCFHT